MRRKPYEIVREAVEKLGWKKGVEAQRHLGVSSSAWSKLQSGLPFGEEILAKLVAGLPKEVGIELEKAWSEDRKRRRALRDTDPPVELKEALASLPKSVQLTLAELIREAEGLPWDVLVQQFRAVVALDRQLAKDLARGRKPQAPRSSS